MDSSRNDEFFRDSQREENDDGRTLTIEQQQKYNTHSNTTGSTVKDKKRVHYPLINGGEHSAINQLRPGGSSSNPNSSSQVDLHAVSINGSNELSTGDHHVISIDKDPCSSCCHSTSISVRRRWKRFIKPWQEFVAYQPRWSWVILVASFLTYSIGEALTSVFPILFVALQEEFPDQGSSSIALVQSMMNAVPCLSGPIASIITTRLGYRKTTMLGGTITSLSLLATSFATHLKILYFTMGTCYAFGNSLVLVATVVAVTEHFDAKPSFASGVTISGGAFGQCVFAIVLQKLLDKYDWNGTMMLVSGVVLSIVAFGALFREVEWDEEDYEDDEGDEEDVDNGNEVGLVTAATSETVDTQVLETTDSSALKTDAEPIPVAMASNTPPATHKLSITDDLVFYDQFTKQELLDQYSRSEICLPVALREEIENQYRQRLESEQKLSSSTTQIQQIDDKERIMETAPLAERSNSCKNLPLIDSNPLTSNKSNRTNVNNNNPRKVRSHHRRPRGLASNSGPHDTKQPIIYYPLHHQHPNVLLLNNNPRAHAAHHHHHHHHHHPLHVNRGNLSHLALFSKNIYNYESVLNLCKLQSLHFSIDRSLSLPNLYSPITMGRKRFRSVTIKGSDDDYSEEEEEDEGEKGEKTFLSQTYRDICKLVRVLRILPFLLLCICVTMITIFYDATWTFLIDYMKKNNLSAEKGTHLVSSVGIIAIFGEIGYGYFGDSKRIFPLHVYATSLCVAGLSQLLIPLVIKSYSLLMPLMLFTSFLQSAQEVLMPILCIKFAGTQNFANAYGMLLLCQGVSSLIGPPILGYIADRNYYSTTYFVIGSGTAIGALLLFTMPLVQKCHKLLKSQSTSQKMNTLVTASNGDLPSPSSNHQSQDEPTMNSAAK